MPRLYDGAVDPWDEYARSYDALCALRPYRMLLHDVVEALMITPCDRILDAGCGTGNILTELQHKHNIHDLFGIDSSGAMLKRASSKSLNAGVPLCQTDLNRNLPFKTHTFHKIVSCNVLYALKSPFHTLIEFFRILQPTGTLVLVTPKKGFDNGLILRAHCNSKKPKTYWKHLHQSQEREELLLNEALEDELLVRHMIHVANCNRSIAAHSAYHFLTRQMLKRLVERAGFAHVTIRRTYAEQSFLVIAKKEERNG